MLYQKHRPDNFKDVFGNASVVNSLIKLVDRKPENIPHAFLFTGPSGCGKTTLARILAKELGAEANNIYEIDSADFRGIEHARDLRRKMNMKPLGGGKCRVYILDEMHQMTKDAQTILLKALEDTPSHVFFMLCTTEHIKILKTIKTRCTTYEVAELPRKVLTRLLRTVMRREGKKVDDNAIELAVKNCAGSPRLALVLLDKLFDLEGEGAEELIEKALQSESNTLELCQELCGRCRWSKLQSILNSLEESKEQPESIRRSILGYCKYKFLNSKNEADHIIAGTVYDNFKDVTYDTGMSGIVRNAHSVVFDRGGIEPF